MKSWAVAYTLLILAYYNENLLICCAKGTMVSIEDSVRKLLVNLIIRLELEDKFKMIDKEIICKHNGSKFIFKGLQHPERIKSTEGIDYFWLEEANVDTSDDTFEHVLPTIRKKGSKLICTFNKQLATDAVYKNMINSDDAYTYKCHTTYKDNIFLSERSKHTIKRMKEQNKARYDHIYGGGFRTEMEGAYWNEELIIHPNKEQLETILKIDGEWDRLVVSLDPAGKDKITSDPAGIIVVGKKDNINYVLEDVSGIMSPKKWATKSIELYHKHNASTLLYESNGVGSTAPTIIRDIDESIHLTDIWSSKNKMTRAHAILYLYEQERVIHVRHFADLEYEMLTYDGDKKKSPNRLDALGFALTNLNPRKNILPEGMVFADMGELLQDGYHF